MSPEPQNANLIPSSDMPNRQKLAIRLVRMAKLLSLHAPHIIILNEWRMASQSFIDCEAYGYDSIETWASVNQRIHDEMRKEEAEHMKNHMDKPPVEGCSWCESGMDPSTMGGP